MKCAKCDYPKKLKMKREDFDYSKTSGIPGCILNGVKTYTCPQCKEKYRDLGPIDEVNDALVDILLGQKKFPRIGVRFVREHYFGETQFQFAARVGTTPQHIQELEQSKKILSDELGQKIQDSVIKHRATDVKITFEV